jgi:hypothetical protein
LPLDRQEISSLDKGADCGDILFACNVQVSSKMPDNLLKKREMSNHFNLVPELGGDGSHE